MFVMLIILSVGVGLLRPLLRVDAELQHLTGKVSHWIFSTDFHRLGAVSIVDWKANGFGESRSIIPLNQILRIADPVLKTLRFVVHARGARAPTKPSILEGQVSTASDLFDGDFRVVGTGGIVGNPPSGTFHRILESIKIRIVVVCGDA